MRKLDRKMLRDLWNMKEQAVAISLVISCGVATFVMALSTLSSLQLTQQTYYDRFRFADVFTQLKRAPLSLADRIAEIPGVSRVDPRIVMDVTLDVQGLAEPAVGRLISVPETHEPDLNAIYLRRGRYIQPGHSEEVLVSEGFADAHGFELGDSVAAIINRRKKMLKIVGIALSPEYIYQIRAGGLIPDDKRFGVFWMGRRPLEAAFDMDGAFNSLSLLLMPGANGEEVLRRLDLLTEPYGGTGAYLRKDQVSHQLLTNEMDQLRAMSLIAPSIFLSVAAFLLNVVVARIIVAQREQIAALKAFGYTNVDIGLHYIKMVLLITVVGDVLGVALGTWIGRSLTGIYARFYHFPVLTFQLNPDIVMLALFISGGAAVIGSIGSVRRAVKLPPAEAMRPEPPANFRATLLERMGLTALLSPSMRMILRHLERQPIKSALSSVGISMALSVLILGSFSIDALDYIIDVQYNFAQRYDVDVAFYQPRPARALHELEQLPGVMRTEPYRAVPVRLRLGHRSRRVAIAGYVPNAELQRPIDENVQPIHLPKQGLALGVKLAELLDARLGDVVTVEVMEGNRQVRHVPVSAIVSEFIGAGAYMDIHALNRLLQEGATISGGYLMTDAAKVDALYDTLKHTPDVAAVNVREVSINNFKKTIAENMLRMRLFNVAFATIIACGVVYNSARIALAERSRELASLRVLGFTRGEISTILLGELAVLTLAAIPLGMALGTGFAWFLTSRLDTDLFRIPLVIDPQTFAFAVIVVLAAAIASGLVVRRKLDHLDLVAVLKSRE
ncbi:MAG: FtsX-like permease family protein [Pirellulales bacterium]|nr:FtsX-like permease family protein [Pirellulales bacterium]